MKIKYKTYADNRRNAEKSNIEIGDVVVQKQHEKNKLSTKFAPEKLIVKGKCENAVTLEDDHENGHEIKRNTSAIKKIETESSDELSDDLCETGSLETPDDKETVRPKRERRPPEYLKDYVTK